VYVCGRISDVSGHFLQSRQTRHRAAASAVSVYDTSKSDDKAVPEWSFRSVALPFSITVALPDRTDALNTVIPQTAHPKVQETSSLMETLC
jgi:hypothetical protein